MLELQSQVQTKPINKRKFDRGCYLWYSKHIHIRKSFKTWSHEIMKSQKFVTILRESFIEIMKFPKFANFEGKFHWNYEISKVYGKIAGERFSQLLTIWALTNTPCLFHQVPLSLTNKKMFPVLAFGGITQIFKYFTNYWWKCQYL